MRKSVIISVFILFSFISLKAQKTFNYSVLLLPLEEHTIIRVNGEKRKLDSLQVYTNNHRIEIQEGKLSLIDTNGNETILYAGEKIEIKTDTSLEITGIRISTLNKISKFINRPSFYLPNLYNNERSSFTIYPLESNVYDKTNIKFYTVGDFIPDAKLYIFHKDNDSLILTLKFPIYEPDFNNSIFEHDKSYTWRLYNGSNSAKGYFRLLPEEEIRIISAYPLNNKMDYLFLFFIFLENECRFDALAILQVAIVKYPDSKLFKNLLNKFFV